MKWHTDKDGNSIDPNMQDSIAALLDVLQIMAVGVLLSAALVMAVIGFMAMLS